jgi:hypothetical protein
MYTGIVETDWIRLCNIMEGNDLAYYVYRDIQR